MARKKKGATDKKKNPIFEKAVAAWLKYDPFVNLVVRSDDRTRRDVMLNLLGPGAAIRHFGKFPQLKPEAGPIYPETVRNTVDASVQDPKKRSMLIKKLIFWASNPGVNNRYLDSHRTRVQIVSSLLGQVFFNSTPIQEDMTLKGLQYLLADKPAIKVAGEKSYEVNEMLLTRVIDLLVHNQKAILNKAISEVEEKMRVHLLRQIQDLRGVRHAIPAFEDTKFTYRQIPKEKFPLRHETSRQLEEILEFYEESEWPELRARAKEADKTIREIRKPLTLTSQNQER